ncbi:hypothetical protein L1987_18762 [Smallanthus sonchifolius]|uniref:Uncharacterized protein n=1 Tax=Smallanthus sonchifolius TaxID=185202 RepID=A0ACB9J171_9ASTR|nr:hypothetical protein L1987_18762 [Smallanthus sonchifolius]
MSNLNIGPVKAFNIMKTMYGGIENVGVTASDCKNFKNDINTYIGEFDADMVVRRLLRKKEFLPNFWFDYQTTDDGALKGLFWADEDSKRNYFTFGDVISFDATYRSNQYNMVFVPFTGIDNHNRNVTLGVVLLGSETVESYKWLLQSFKEAFLYEPQVVVTDQDPAMKRAIEDVFTSSRHRLCMWHVMEKLAVKVGSRLCNNTDFKKQICDIVWTDSITPDEFEREWHRIINEFQLTSNKWLSDMFEIRDSWIPAYYRHENMSGLMRTTSRSESENHFFGQVCSSKSTLVEFLSHFETAVEGQRHEHRKNDHDTRYNNPAIWSDFILEKQAAQVYIRTIFNDVQLEIQAACHKCVSAMYINVDDFLKFSIKDLEQPFAPFFEVMFRQEDVTVTCSCNRYE